MSPLYILLRIHMSGIFDSSRDDVADKLSCSTCHIDVLYATLESVDLTGSR